ncbi:hypothetical protein KC717_00235 [Candidatus Dojkabacteria bacterium]|uniref:Uncharacterized protein n=1 Tax=Candidatus Dojkabacteria bacterium TaxID=2099670 RepID=A0A955L6X5_9BACT|nr:hypothetical protein [Candidatus Dojkabacteria bacterium]
MTINDSNSSKTSSPSTNKSWLFLPLVIIAFFTGGLASYVLIPSTSTSSQSEVVSTFVQNNNVEDQIISITEHDTLRVEEVVEGLDGRFDFYRNSDDVLVFSQSNPINDPHSRNQGWIGKLSDNGQYIIIQRSSYGVLRGQIASHFAIYEYDFKTNAITHLFDAGRINPIEMLGEHNDPIYDNCTSYEDGYFTIRDTVDCRNESRIEQYVETIEFIEELVNQYSEEYISVQV